MAVTKAIWNFKNEQTKSRAEYLYNEFIQTKPMGLAIALTRNQLHDEGLDTTPGLGFEPVPEPIKVEVKQAPKKLETKEFVQPTLFNLDDPYLG